MMNYNKLLKSKKYEIAVWGQVTLVLSTLVYYSKKNIRCTGYDINKSKVKKINKGILPIKDLKNWFEFDIKNLVRKNICSQQLITKNIIDKKYLVHFIAIY